MKALGAGLGLADLLGLRLPWWKMEAPPGLGWTHPLSLERTCLSCFWRFLTVPAPLPPPTTTTTHTHLAKKDKGQFQAGTLVAPQGWHMQAPGSQN